MQCQIMCHITIFYEMNNFLELSSYIIPFASRQIIAYCSVAIQYAWQYSWKLHLS